jgi:hypothetical protein
VILYLAIAAVLVAGLGLVTRSPLLLALAVALTVPFALYVSGGRGYEALRGFFRFRLLSRPGRSGIARQSPHGSLGCSRSASWRSK